MRFIHVAAACALLAGVVASASAAPSADSPPTSGKLLFAANGCAQCHGTLGQGNPSAGIKLAPHPLPYSAFVAQLRKPRGEMPPYSAHLVNERDAHAIYAFLESIHDGRTAAQIPMLASVGNGNAGPTSRNTLAVGRIVFAQNCASCHGTAGGGGGVGPALVGEHSRKDLAATIAIIKHPIAPMPVLYPAPLDERAVAEVAAYVQSL